ncbi:flagellar basal body rod protein FlgC [Elioraea tepidiphila]|jgi:flagellar basal-body rod protein FlgC|uniref:flagellar basal body rod protein FlgC n=1 Tax=Elioraea tepidiphila TaxID=457934 RepID=UPI00036EED44|nr:flagellar basal body rod protein FlgC [Elioraea tepidiphila]
MDLFKALRLSAAGMDAQAMRLRIVAENLANRDTTASTPDGEPYRRKTITFESRFNRALGVEQVHVKRVGRDESAFGTRFEPGHPAADENGYVKVPNVNSFIEMMDMREAQRSYSANLNVLEVTRGMLTRAIELLR